MIFHRKSPCIINYTPLRSISPSYMIVLLITTQIDFYGFMLMSFVFRYPSPPTKQTKTSIHSLKASRLLMY
uniref:Uncharacterized protein n=1 Tax=Utricularia reniformis TaxID=192314 RepID=A0A1Y0AZH0_9LAMI|nr:hypothetical protein AEK19_MT0251 [Utricularia reniformis]ART30528.1 hypothetical protein AEK19_MT0251 [Utricularia reniformis]